MKVLIASLLALIVCSSAQAGDSEIIKFKDWRADKIDSHKVTEKKACVAKTQVVNEDTALEVYSESSPNGGFVQPVVQIVTTAQPPALGVIAKTLPGGKKFPLSIALNETKTFEVEVPGDDGEPVKKEVERQVFLVKFQNKDQFIRFIKGKNSIESTFFNAEGDIAKVKFSLRGSHKTVSKLMETCI